MHDCYGGIWCPGRTLVDASKWSANVLMVNPSSEVVILPSFTCVGDLGPGVSSVHSSLGTGVSGDESTPPGSPGGYCDGLSSLLGGGGSDDTQEYIASVCSCVSDG